MKLDLTNEEMTILIVTLQKSAREWWEQGKEEASDQREDLAYKLQRIQEEEAM